MKRSMRTSLAILITSAFLSCLATYVAADEGLSLYDNVASVTVSETSDVILVEAVTSWGADVECDHGSASSVGMALSNENLRKDELYAMIMAAYLGGHKLHARVDRSLCIELEFYSYSTILDLQISN